MRIALASLLLLGCGGVTRASYRSHGGDPSTDDATSGAGGTPSVSAGGSSLGGSAGQPGVPGGSPLGGGAGQVGGAPHIPTIDERAPSSGCFNPPPPNQELTIPGSRTGYTEFFVDQTGANLGVTDPSKAGQRQFFVRLPPDYDNYRAYRVVYIGQGCGAQRAGKTNTYALFDEHYGGVEDAVYVAVSVPDNDANPGCYDNNSGPQSQEWEAFELIHDFVESRYCVDNHRIFVAGYSTGGWLSNMWGCYFGGTPTPERKFAPKWAIRGYASVFGALPENQPRPCNGPAAGLWLYDDLVWSERIWTGPAAINLQLETNGCTGNYADGPSEPWAPGESIPGLAGGKCQHYTGCPSEVDRRYPIVSCTTSGEGHGDQPQNAIAAFTRFFDSMDPLPPQ